MVAYTTGSVAISMGIQRAEGILSNDFSIRQVWMAWGRSTALTTFNLGRPADVEDSTTATPTWTYSRVLSQIPICVEASYVLSLFTVKMVSNRTT